MLDEKMLKLKLLEKLIGEMDDATMDSAMPATDPSMGMEMEMDVAPELERGPDMKEEIPVESPAGMEMDEAEIEVGAEAEPEEEDDDEYSSSFAKKLAASQRKRSMGK